MTSVLPHIETTSGPDPEAAVIWLHGLGADGNDFAAIVPELDLRGCPPIRFVFPHAPSMPVTINGGYVMPAWYDIISLARDERRIDSAGVLRSCAAIRALIARENQRGIPTRNIVIAGFSQGGAIALQGGLRQAERLAGILALSTYLPIASTLEGERTPANADCPILMIHGTHDPVIPLDRALASRDRLQALGYPVRWQTYPMQHSVCAEEIALIAGWLRERLG